MRPRFATLAALVCLALTGGAAAQTSIPGRPPDPIDQSRQRSLGGVPRGPVTPAPTDRWVPVRRVYGPEFGRDVVVPGHHERELSPQQYQVPPLTIYGPLGQQPVFVPGGPRPPADLRQAP
jgi:hypothetical protein